MSASFSDNFSRIFAENGLSAYVSRETSEKFELLASLLSEANGRFNLTAITEENSVILRHFADSVFVSGQIPDGGSVIDVGSGAGFPSLPLAIVRPDVSVVSLDSTAKKLGFIDSAASGLGLSNVKTVCARAEDASSGALREKFDVSLARAVARLNVLCELCIPFVKPGGKFIALKGPGGFDEAKEASDAFRLLGGGDPVFADYRLINGNETEIRTLVISEKLRDTPRNYPRKYAQILKKPLQTAIEANVSR